jgi:hypothetical protein
MDELGETFEELAQDAIREAEQIECSLEQFKDGLRTMRDAFQTRYEQVCEELRHHASGTEDE